MYDNRKRKRHSDYPNKSKRNHSHNDWQDDFRGSQGQPQNREVPGKDSVLFLQAHEADLRRGPDARDLAASLEMVQLDNESPHGSTRKIGSALIRWVGGSGPSGHGFDDQNDTISLGAKSAARGPTSVQDTSGVWVDRFDARLLLDSLPEFGFPSKTTSPPRESIPGSPSGWSDLPSDIEDTFFFSPEEAEDYRNEKRRRLFEQAQEDRVRARLEEEDVAQEEEEDDPWGGSDEEPEDAQKELMRRTAAHLLASPNPAQLEMRILANHGADKRFAFLKGRWSHSWLHIKAKLRAEKEEKERKEKERKAEGLGMLAGYDTSSDEDSDNAENDDKNVREEGLDAIKAETEETKKELRRQKAKEWAEKRRAQTNVAETTEQ
ncbi:hypothetical protein NP233_g7134 [Leucocoprinus birnbaumii]|uniref:SURP motif domain-containing protein n=1 Tax=Leucocoprinus birnbaumii TaxID=56174 RepID=A0AAD5YT28_9AGAR|nr:hypothetical protein NP233_g7134 [Leucocoprinus birnbaumii]